MLFSEILEEWRDMKAITFAGMHDQIGYLVGRITGPSLGSVEHCYSDWIIVLTIEKIDHQCGEVTMAVIGLTP